MSSIETIQLQLSEVEVLKSIYPNENEIVINNFEDDIMIMKQYVESNGESLLPSNKLSMTVNIKMDNNNGILKVEVALPINYPLLELPEIFLRCDCMTRNMQQKLNEEMQSYLKPMETGEMCLYEILQWATENAERFVTPSNTSLEDAETSPKPHSCSYLRLWIYSHHIYNKDKRKCIIEWAKELELSGFSMPGKPGIVCVEGVQEHCEEYWQRLKRQTWKRLSIVHREDIGLNREQYEINRKFMDILTEKDFGVHGGRDYHMDLGRFLEFLTEHSCQNVFSILFGVEGKISKKT